MSCFYPFLIDHSYSLPFDRDRMSWHDSNRQRKSSVKKEKIMKNDSRTVSIVRPSSAKRNYSSICLPKPTRKIRKNSNTAKLSQKNKFMKKTQVKVRHQRHTLGTLSLDLTPSLSIEERVKLRRTRSELTEKTLGAIVKTYRSKKTMPPKKFFLGSGIDLDNILLGNRQRRSVQI